jgi:hypothetical protein
VLETGEKSVWMTGNYGTGKSNAALVVQKLFMDDAVRVKSWLDKEDGKGLADRQSMENGLFARREDGTLVVFDFNAAGFGPNEGLLVRLEKGVIAALNERGLIVPAKSNMDSVIARLKREGAHFFTTRDRIQGKLAYLHAGIKSVEQLVEALGKERKDTDAPSELLDDVQRVFHEDNIYLDVNVPMFRAWVAEILIANQLKQIVYIFDEFHPFIEKNKDQLKTFEEVTESPSVNRFFLIPVTHMQITAYLAEGSDSAKKANDRFYFRNLQMPNNTAFYLAHRAMEEKPGVSDEWKVERDNLWTTISPVVDKFPDTDVSRESFYNILPIHPMAAFLLKFLSESAKSNQRSLFEYLKGSADGREFQDFITAGGPDVANKQFLTVDYLWDYFINRKDLGLNSDIAAIGLIYRQICDRAFSNQTEDAIELRVLRAVLLFCLLDRLTMGGVHDRLKPTVENIELSFKGDGVITDPAGIVKDLANRHCFSVVDGSIELYTTSVGGPELQRKIAEQETKFHELLSPKVSTMLETHTKSYRQYSSGRFDIRVSDVSHTTPSNLNASTKERFGKGQNKDDASVCLWFVVAKNKEEQLLIPDKIEKTLSQLKDLRIMMFTFPTLTFCQDNAELWNEYVRQYAQYLLENNDSAKKSIMATLEKLEQEWLNKMNEHTAALKVYTALDGHVTSTDTSWSVFRDLIENYIRGTLPNCVDYLTQQITVFSNSGLKTWALVGIQFNAVSGQHGQLVKSLISKNITSDDDWFSKNSKHPLAEIHALFEKKIANTIGKGGQLSVRKVYIELQRAPFGMRYNALSAFVLGFVLRGILSKNYQWTDGRLTKPLDADTLAEIIESVVKNDGNDNMRGEKFICRLSKEEKAFVEKAPLMFNVSPIPDATVESVLGQIQTCIQSISERVPLWALPEYIRAEGDGKADMIDVILDNICTAFTTSSKGKTEDRTNAIVDVGSAILSDPEIVDLIAGYVKRENFIRAFELYVDSANPGLAQLALKVGDVSHQYCRAILDKTAEAAGWLWKKADISKEIDETLCEYETISLAKQLLKYTEFTPYKDVVSALHSAVTQSNRLPRQMIEAAYPVLSNFHSAVQNGGSAQYIKPALSQNAAIIEKLFFSTAKAKSLEILKSRLGDVPVSNIELLGILNGMAAGFGLDESTFLDGFKTKIEEHLKQSVIQKIKEEWERLSSGVTPSEWAIVNKLPARFLLGGISETYDILKAIEQPETFSASRLAELLDVLRNFSASSIAECQNAFLKETVPQKYADLKISLASLIDYMHEKQGGHPNYWKRHTDITEFIRSQYKNTFALQVAEKIRAKPADELKQRLLELAQENEEVGLLFWEV